jgi:hypothetical protein
MVRIAPAVGGCSCGKLRYRVTKEPFTVYICHCHQCQKRTGSAFSMSLVMAADGFQIAEGEPARSERVLSDGQRNISVSCSKCHSRLYTQHTERNNSKTINLRVGTLDDASQIRPVAQMWTSSAQPWAIQQNILSYSGQPTDFRPWLDAWKAIP